MMGRSPHSDENGIKKGPWTPEEDRKLVDYIRKNGHESWRALPKLAGLNRCGKSCRLRWTNYLRPDLKRGKFSDEEEQTIIHLHSILGNKWSAIASRLPGRTDNEIKNYWNTQLKKKLLRMGIDPLTHRPITNLPQLLAAANITKYFTNLSDSTTHVQIANIQLLHNLIQLLNTNTAPNNLIHPACPQSNSHLSISEFLRMNSSFDHHLIPQEPSVQIPSSFLLKTSPEPPSCPFAELAEYKDYQLNSISSSGHDDQLDSSLYANPSTSTNQIPIPALVSISSPRLTQMETNVNTVHTSNPSSTPNSFQAWDDTDLMGEETDDSYWKNFMDQASCQTWPFPE